MKVIAKYRFFNVLSHLLLINLFLHISFLEIDLGLAYYIPYIIVLAYFIFISIKEPKIVNKNFIALYLIILISLIFNDTPSFFRSEERAFIFMVMVFLMGPLIYFQSIANFRFIFVKNLMKYSFIIVCISFLGLLINFKPFYNFSGFTGMVNHSMVLGPISSLVTVYSIFKFLNSRPKPKRNRFIIYGLIGFLTCIAAGSRIALVACVFGVFVILYLQNKFKISKWLKSLIIISILVLVSFPLWIDFADHLLLKMAYARQHDGLTTTRQYIWESRIKEFISSPFYGIGFASIDPSIGTKFDIETGKVEPGSSWLAVLSNVGILGFYFIVISIIKILRKVLSKKNNISHELTSYGVIFLMFIFHMIAEGYIFSAGAGLFVYFWSLFGVLNRLLVVKNKFGKNVYG